MNDIQDVRAERELLLQQREKLIDQMIAAKALYMKLEKQVHLIEQQLQSIQS